MKKMLLISSDTHASPMADGFRPYLERKYHGALDEFSAEQEQELKERLSALGASDSVSNVAVRDDFDERIAFATTLECRLEIQERDGYVAELIFPDVSVGNSIPFTGRFIAGVGPKKYEPELWTAGLRAYNRWLGEHSSPGRQLGVGLIAFHDPTYALTQVRNARKIGLRGVMPQWDGLDTAFLPLYDEAFDPVWSACVEESLPVSFHPLAGRPRDTYFGVDETIPFSAGPFISRKNTQSTMIFEAESLFWSRRCLWHMILGGVLERHPQLRVGFVEMWTDWIPRTLEWLDYLLERKARGRLTKWESVCPLPASEYWRRQCFVGAHAWSLDDIELRQELGVDTFTFGTDFPHANSPVNQVTPFLRATLGASNVSESDARAILGENMVRIYDLDIAMLEPIADRVGPLPEEILRIPSNQDANEGLSPYLQMTIHHPPVGAG